MSWDLSLQLSRLLQDISSGGGGGGGGVQSVTTGYALKTGGTPTNPIISADLINGTGIALSGTGPVSIDNTGIIAAAAGPGIVLTPNPTANAPRIDNIGVLALTQSTGISITGTNANLTVANTGVLGVSPGTGITITGTAQAPIINTSVTAFRPTYTLYVAPNGNDITGTGAYGNPFQTIQRALTERALISDAFEVGISIAEGNYTESPTIATGRTYLYGPSATSRQQSVNIVGTITVNIPSISTVGTEYVVGFNSLQITGNINAQAAASGPFTVVIGNCLIAGNIVLTRTGASAASARIENNTITCGGGDTIGFSFGGFAVTMLNNLITCNATTQPCIQLVNATGYAVAATLFINYNIITMAGAGTTLGAIIRHNSTNNATGCQCNYNLFQYTATGTDTGTQNKSIIQQVAASSTTYDTVCYNVMLVPGASFTGGSGQPVVIQERAGSLIINAFGGNYALPSAYRIDNNVTHTALNLVS